MASGTQGGHAVFPPICGTTVSSLDPPHVFVFGVFMLLFWYPHPPNLDLLLCMSGTLYPVIAFCLSRFFPGLSHPLPLDFSKLFSFLPTTKSSIFLVLLALNKRYQLTFLIEDIYSIVCPFQKMKLTQMNL